MSNRRHKLMAEIEGLRDVTARFDFLRGQRYGGIGGRCVIDDQIPDFSHVKIFPKDGIRAVHVCNMTSTFTSSLIQYCRENDVIVTLDARSFINGREGWFEIKFPEDAAYCYVSSSNGTMKILK